METNVAIDKVAKRYGTIAAVENVTLALHEAETTALVGHNGAGKTTLMKLMLGLAQPTEGTIRVLGENPAAGEFAARRRLGYLPENVSFNPGLTGREILSFYSRLKREPVEKALALLDRVGLGPASDRRIGSYSKGMRQRLGLAQALIGEPRILLLDEPTTGLDPALRQSFYEIMQELRDCGTTVVLSSHALAEIEDRSDRIVIMNRGRVVASGTIQELRRMVPLPSKIRLELAEEAAPDLLVRLGPLQNLRQLNGHTVLFDAPMETKVEAVRRATELGAPVKDIQVIPPTLDELYAHLAGSDGPR